PQRKPHPLATAPRGRDAAEQAAGSPASPPRGPPDGDSALAARYAAALREAILRQWTRPDSVPLGQVCRISITQLPGGEVISVEFDPSCPYDGPGRRSVDRKSTRLNSSHVKISYAVSCLKKKSRHAGRGQRAS